MLNFEYFKQKSPSQRFLFVLRLAILFVYLGIGGILIFTRIVPLDPEKFPRHLQQIFGVLLIIYGVFRFYRLVKDEE